jgi:hypothetical protein
VTHIVLAVMAAGCAAVLVAGLARAAHSAPKPKMSSESESLMTVRITKPALHIHKSAIRPVNEIPYRFLAKVADKAIRLGHVYSSRWGDASPWLKRLCYEMVERAFAPYGTQGWALHVVNRESGCNPAAINSSSGTTGIAQIHPAYHRWVDYHRVQRDMAYAVRTFMRLSRNGKSTGPWCLC